MYQCPRCDYDHEKIRSLSNHAIKKHKISSEQLYVELFCNGKKPTCACGCGEFVKFEYITTGFRDYVVGHSHRINLPDEAIEKLGKIKDKEIAKEFNVDVEIIRRKRRKLGIKSCSNFSKKQLNTINKKINWKEQPLGKKSDAKIARDLNIDPATVSRHRRKLGIKEYKDPKRTIDWSKVPLGEMDDEEIAKDLGVTARTVCRKRKKLGIPSYYEKNKINWDEQPLGKVTDSEIAKKLNISVAAVGFQRKKRNIKKIIVQKSSNEIDWSKLSLGDKPDKEIAESLGVSVGKVRKERSKLGIKSWAEQNRRAMEDSLGIDWNEQPLGKMSDIDLANKLGIDSKFVYRARRKRGIRAFGKIDKSNLQNGEIYCKSCQTIKKEKDFHPKQRKIKSPECKQCKINKRRKREEKNPEVKIRRLLRRALKRALRTYSKSGKVKSSKEYGIDYQSIFERLGPKPNSKDKWHIDHIVALSLFDLNSLEHIKIAFSPENHQWLTEKENILKGSKLPEINSIPKNLLSKCQKLGIIQT